MTNTVLKGILGIFISMSVFSLSCCESRPEPDNMQEISEIGSEESEEQDTKIGEDMNNTQQKTTNDLYIEVRDSILTAVLEDNESAEALKELLSENPLTISASNYGGFEKVCSLGMELPRNDRQTTTEAGDICLYNGNQIVIFYGSNSWSYTRLGKVSNTDKSQLEEILSGEETEITLSLKPFD